MWLIILLIIFIIGLPIYFYKQLTNINEQLYLQLNENKELKFDFKIYKKAVEQAIEDLMGEFSSEYCNQERACVGEDKDCKDCMYQYFFEMVDSESYWIRRKYEEGKK
jgi:hypothetical protein